MVLRKIRINREHGRKKHKNNKIIIINTNADYKKIEMS